MPVGITDRDDVQQRFSLLAMSIRDLRTHRKAYVTVRELGEYLNLSVRMLYREIAAGELGTKRFGRAIRIPVDEARRYASEERGKADG